MHAPMRLRAEARRGYKVSLEGLHEGRGVAQAQDKMQMQVEVHVLVRFCIYASMETLDV